MKKKVLMVLLAATLSVSMIAGCGSKGDNNTDTTKTESKQDSDQEAADKVAKLIDDIYVQERTVPTIQPNLNSQPKKKIRRRQIKWQS